MDNEEIRDTEFALVYSPTVKRYSIPDSLKHLRWFKVSTRMFAIQLAVPQDNGRIADAGLIDQTVYMAIPMQYPSTMNELLIVW